MFKAFFDESGTDPAENKALVVGGFLARAEEWERASDAWDECLHLSTAIEYFSHNEAKTLDKQFGKLSRAQASEKVMALATTISKFNLLGLCASVPHRLFADRDSKATRGFVGTRAYDWGFAAATSMTLQYLAETTSENERVDFIFDERSELRSCIDLFYMMKEHATFSEFMVRSGQCIPGDDKQVVALQMADLLAWEFSKAGETGKMSAAMKIIRENNRIGHRPCRPPAQFMPTLRIHKLSNEVRNEAIKFLKQSRNPPQNPAAGVSEQFTELLARETYFNVEWGKLLLKLDSDEAYQQFKEKYLEGIGPEDDLTI